MSATRTMYVEALASESLRNWLLYALEPAIERVNTERQAVVSAGLPGPYTIPPTADTAKFYLGTTKGTAADGPEVPAGDYTAAELVTLFNNANPYSAIEAQVDAVGRFSLITTDGSGTVNGPAKIYVGRERTAGFNAALGWPQEIFTQLRALEVPGYDEIMDGMPILDGFNRPIAIILGDRKSRPMGQEHRRDEYETTIDVTILARAQQGENHKNRELIQAAVRAVRTALFDTAGGRQLGVASGDSIVVRVVPRECFIGATPFNFSRGVSQPPLYDVAVLTLSIVTYERTDL